MHNPNIQTLLTAQVPPERDKYRLDQVLAYLFPEYSRTYLQAQIKNQQVKLEGQWINQIDYKVAVGQWIQVTPVPNTSLDQAWTQATSIDLSIVYEDDALLIINKPADLVTHPAPGHLTHTLANALLHYNPKLGQLPRAGIIHRLDQGTSGLLVVPKTLSTYTRLSKALAARQIERSYRAIVQGVPLTSGTIEVPIGRHPTKRQKQAVTLKGKSAITHYRILERFRHYTSLVIQLETGRTHQIRVHMAHIGYPILGDPVYGRSMPKKISAQSLPSLNRQALHAHTLGLIHPITQQFCRWEAPIPEDMQTVLIQLQTNHGLDLKSLPSA